MKGERTTKEIVERKKNRYTGVNQEKRGEEKEEKNKKKRKKERTKEKREEMKKEGIL